MAATLVGFAVGLTTYGVLLATLDDSLALGAVVYGALATVLAFVSTYIIAVLAMTFRSRPAGNRLTGVVVLVVLPFSVLGTAVAVDEYQSNSERRDNRRQVLDAHGALVLIDGETLDRPFPDWELRSVSVHATFGVEVDWTLGKPYDAASLTLGDVGAIERCTYCQEVGQRSDGSPILAGSSIYLTSIGSTEYKLRILGDHDARQAVDLLRRLQPVNSDEFSRACGRRC